MNSPRKQPELEQLRQQLEWATARQPKTTGQADRESLELRESWDALAECLEAVDATWDEHSWVERLAREEPVARRSARWSFSLALSLSLIVLSAFVWLDRLAFQGAEMLAQKHAHRDLARESAQPGAGGAGSTDNAWEWNDGIDQQLVEAHETLVAIRSDWYPSDRVELLSQRMQELRNEWDDESL
ncbi:MAG: hypothetical protein U1A77_05270 [Pirellulales bacterium]